VTVRIGTAEVRGTVQGVSGAIDPGQLSATGTNAIAQNHVGEIELLLNKRTALDAHSVNPRTGRLALELDGRIAGGGLVLSYEDTVHHATTHSSRTASSQGPVGARLLAQAAELNEQIIDLTPAERLARLRAEIEGRVVFTTSFGLEDQAITHLLHEHGVDLDVVTLDTGRLFPETYELWAETERRYGLRIRAFYPENIELEALVAKQGINGFYQSREARNACCRVRKVVPLNRALDGARAWVTGLRADQSTHRGSLAVVTADMARGLLKLSPFFDWSREALMKFVENKKVPINALHAQGFASIGCAPCTQAIASGEPERAGRWWWENEDKKECGLHLTER
jgi:phosphoadenosine phosphosulfate reductase